MQLEVSEDERKSVVEKSSATISDRDAQIHQFSEALRSLSDQLKVAQESHRMEREEFKRQVLWISRLRVGIAVGARFRSRRLRRNGLKMRRHVLRSTSSRRRTRFGC